MMVAPILSILMLVPLVDAHSWADCVDWRSTTQPPNWSSSGGECFAWGRRYPVSNKIAFGDLDSASPNRHYFQSPLPAGTPYPCSDSIHGVDPGSNELRANPPSAAYGGSLWGAMPQPVQTGSTICVRWPANNHALDESAFKSPGGNRVSINFLIKTSVTDPDQTVFTSNNIASLLYGNCTDLSSNCPNSALVKDNPDLSNKYDTSQTDPMCTKYIPCGGCFTVPERSPGIYTVQWRWQLNPDEFYTSCWDVSVINNQSGQNSTIYAVPSDNLASFQQTSLDARFWTPLLGFWIMFF